MRTENWMSIEGYEGIYEISDLGRVRSLNYHRSGETRILKPGIDRGGYLMVVLSKDGKRKTVKVHRLVATAFVPNMFGLNEVNHINEVKTDNREENLMWVDSKENDNWGSRNQRIGEKLSKPVLQFTKSGEFIREWPSTAEVERELGYSNTHISECCSGKRKSACGFVWKYL